MPFIPILVGTAAVSGGAGATAGIIGTGGAITGAGLLTGAGIAAGVTGGVMSAMAASAQGKMQKSMMEYNAKVNESERKQLEAKAEYDQIRQANAAARGISALESWIGASGAVTGSPLLIKAKQASEYELENLMIGYEGQTGANRARSQAGLDLMQGDIYGRAGRAGTMAGYMGAGTTILSGLGSSGIFNPKPRPSFDSMANNANNWLNSYNP